MWFKTLMLSALIAYSGQMFAAMYKWTDEQGNVHYTQTPPPDREVQKILAPRPVDTPPEANQPAADKPAAGATPRPPSEEDIRIKKQNCETARSNLDIYQNAPRIRNEDGSITGWTEKERAEKIKESQEQIKKYCK